MPATLQPVKTLSRLDRHVGRTNLRIASEASQFSVTCALEEALRLAILPGEEEGRIYIFNKVSLHGLPTHADRRLWMDRVQATLTTVAASAVPGSHPYAATANAVYFNSTEEAFELLLTIALRCLSPVRGKRSERVPWFVAAFIGLPSRDHVMQQPEVLIEALLERIVPPAMPLSVAASILLSVVDVVGHITLLTAIPEQTLRAWLSGFTTLSTALRPRPDTTPLVLSSALQNLVSEVAAHFGWRSLEALWITIRAVASRAPFKPVDEVYRCAVASLREMEAPLGLRSSPRFRKTAAFDLSPVAPVSSATGTENRVVTTDSKFERESTSTQHEEILATPPVKSEDRATGILGEPTLAAGLYFFLHVLRHLGIVEALNDNPGLAEADLPAHILTSLALSFRVALNDPILLPLNVGNLAFTPSEETLAGLNESAYPILGRHRFIRTSTSTADNWPITSILSPPDLLDLWMNAVRLWCLRNARITVREIIRRPGRLWLTRTDLDVTLPLASTDLRIRRAGLDIDPLWLPWFGPTGRVVRFHYRHSTDTGAA